MIFRSDEQFRELVPMPTDRTSLAREIRYCQSYLQAHRL
jgi:hypothetical protein